MGKRDNFQDELGSPIRLADKDGEVEESYGYDEFGQDLYGNQGIVQPFGYTRYQADRITGTYYAQAREYMPLNGSFISKDQDRFYKIVMATSWNLYVYCSSDSLRFIDPQGHEGREGRDGNDGIDTIIGYVMDGYDLTYIWNDVMDPNLTYQSDAEKANAAQLIPGANQPITIFSCHGMK